jgi:hypothetical protein
LLKLEYRIMLEKNKNLKAGQLKQSVKITKLEVTWDIKCSGTCDKMNLTVNRDIPCEKK